MSDDGTEKPSQMLVALKLIGALVIMGLSIWLLINAMGK